MGYDLHITRTDDWAGNVGREISPDEWLAVVKADPELRLEPGNGPYFAAWRSASGDTGWLDWDAGNVAAKNPSPPLVLKMCQIAAVLSARVQGDDGEFYPDSLGCQGARPRSSSWYVNASGLLLVVTAIVLTTLMLRYPDRLTAPGNQLPLPFVLTFLAAWLLHIAGLVVTLALQGLLLLRERRVTRVGLGAVALGLIPVILLLVARR